jgi:SAM-dependent methyltransferase
MFEERYVNQEHLEKVPEWHTEESPWKVRHIRQLLERNQLSPKGICEVGCGFGEVLRLMQNDMSEECEFWGYEISPVALEQAEKQANSRLHFKLADFTRESTAPFDLLLALDVVEHVADYLGFLQEIRPKGQYKIFQVPLELSVQTVIRHRALLKQRDSMGHLHYFTKETFLRSLEDCGYEVIDYVYTSSSLELPTHVLTTKLMKVPRQLLSAANKDLAARVLGGYRLMVLAR